MIAVAFLAHRALGAARHAMRAMVRGGEPAQGVNDAEKPSHVRLLIRAGLRWQAPALPAPIHPLPIKHKGA